MAPRLIHSLQWPLLVSERTKHGLLAMDECPQRKTMPVQSVALAAEMSSDEKCVRSAVLKKPSPLGYNPLEIVGQHLATNQFVERGQHHVATQAAVSGIYGL